MSVSALRGGLKAYWATITALLGRLYKVEMRRSVRTLGLLGRIVRRQPFPGLGLALRVVGGAAPEKPEIPKNDPARLIYFRNRRHPRTCHAGRFSYCSR